MKATVDKDTCIGCELCVNHCPEVFAPDGEGKVKVIANPVPAAAEAKCRIAGKECPVEAIKINI
jgi:ferredoxin